MLRRRQINAGPRGPLARFARELADAADRLAGGGRRPLERLAWPFERAAWAVERRLLWPLRERGAGRLPSARVAGAGALAAVAAAAVLAGVLLSEGNGGETVERVAGPARVAEVAAAGADGGGSPGSALHGVPPSFGVGKGVDLGKRSGGGEADASEAAVEAASGEAGEASAAQGGGEALLEEEATASASSAAPVPAGPQAMKVARRFSHAFVYYEVGERTQRAKTVFEATATPRLAAALEKRPPRLPARAQVPRAKVVNLVPGPRRGSDYTVSVSLLRVGLTSELRITMRHDEADGWQVAEVLG